MKRLACVLLALLAALCLGGCSQEEQADPYAGVPNPIATITLADGRVMRAELYLSQAPNTVANFTQLANEGFYDGQEFFRVVAGAFVQTGDPLGNGTGGPGYSIRGEFSENGFEGNTLSHTRGVLSMARTQDYDSAGSQFFIMQGSYPEYDGYYAAFGKLMDDESLETLDAIATLRTDSNYRPLVITKIETIRVDTQGYTFPVIKIEPEETAPSASPTAEPMEGADA